MSIIFVDKHVQCAYNKDVKKINMCFGTSHISKMEKEYERIIKKK